MYNTDPIIFVLMFIGAVAFVFSLKSNEDGWFLFYTALFAFCVAAVVVLIY